MLNIKKSKKQQISTDQCKSLIQSKYHQLTNQYMLNTMQQELVQRCSQSLTLDLLKEEQIKDKLKNNFFNTPNRIRRKKYYLQQKLKDNSIIDRDIRKKLSIQLKKQFSIKSPDQRSLLLTPQPDTNRKNRYNDSRLSSPLNLRSPITPSLSKDSPKNRSKTLLYSLQIDTIIQESEKMSSKEPVRRRKIMTASERNRRMEQDYKDEKNQIIEKIIENQVGYYLKNQLMKTPPLTLEQKKKRYETIKRRQLSNMEKYSMSFQNYMKQKTFKNIEKVIYDEKIRFKDSFIQKFQEFILNEIKFTSESKRRLENIFKSIEKQYKRSQTPRKRFI